MARARRQDDAERLDGPIGSARIGPAALGDGPIGGRPGADRRRRSLGGTLLLAAWLLLIGVVAAGAVYVYWPAIEPQVAGLTGEVAETAEELPTVEVGTSEPVAPPADPGAAAPEEAASPQGETQDAGQGNRPGNGQGNGERNGQGAGDELSLSEPQATPMSEGERPAADTGRTATGGEGQAAQPPAGDAATAEGQETGAQGAGAGAGGESGGQVAALPQAPPSPPPAPPPPEEPAWKRYAAPFTAPADRPLVAVVLTGLGLNGPRTLQAIEQLPPEISLSFSPYGKQTEEFMRTARAFGHEVLLDLPMEPASADDPGTLAMLTSLAPGQNLDRLDIVLTRGRGYVGVVGALGSRFVGNPESLKPVLEALYERGLLYLDNRPLDEPLAARAAGQMGIPVAINDRSLDARMAATPAVDASLAQVERIARERGTAVALGEPNPSTIAELKEWVASLSGKGLALAPVTAVANTQPIR